MKIPKPNLIDKAVTYFAPIKAVSRLKARIILAATGGYTGARIDRRATKMFRPGANTADQAILPDLKELRERSQDLVRNAPIAAGAINTNDISIIGPGLRLQAKVDREFLGLSDEAADKLERNLEREFNLWTKCPDNARKYTWPVMQSVALRSMLDAGDVLAAFRYKETVDTPYGFKVQLIDGGRLSNPNNKMDSDTLAGGVEMRADGEPIAYHTENTSPGNTVVRKQEWTRLPARSHYGRRMVLHIYQPTRVDQTRGVPYLAPVIESLKQLTRYSEAEIEAAVIASFFTVFVKSESSDGLGTFEPNDETGALSDDEDYKLGSGAILDLMPGEDISTANPGRPNAQFDPFFLAYCRQIGVALNLPFEILVKHFTASYSAARAALLEAWRWFRTTRARFAESFHQPIYGEVIDEAVSRGRISAPGYFSDAAIREAYLGADWIGPAPGQIDPVKEIDAAEKAVSLGVRSRSEITQELYSTDWESTQAQLSKENKRRSEDGMATVAATSDGQAPESAPENDEKDDLPEEEDKF